MNVPGLLANMDSLQSEDCASRNLVQYNYFQIIEWIMILEAVNIHFHMIFLSLA